MEALEQPAKGNGGITISQQKKPKTMFKKRVDGALSNMI